MKNKIIIKYILIFTMFFFTLIPSSLAKQITTTGNDTYYFFLSPIQEENATKKDGKHEDPATFLKDDNVTYVAFNTDENGKQINPRLPIGVVPILPESTSITDSKHCRYKSINDENEIFGITIKNRQEMACIGLERYYNEYYSISNNKGLTNGCITNGDGKFCLHSECPDYNMNCGKYAYMTFDQLGYIDVHVYMDSSDMEGEYPTDNATDNYINFFNTAKTKLNEEVEGVTGISTDECVDGSIKIIHMGTFNSSSTNKNKKCLTDFEAKREKYVLDDDIDEYKSADSTGKLKLNNKFCQSECNPTCDPKKEKCDDIDRAEKCPDFWHTNGGYCGSTLDSSYPNYLMFYDGIFNADKESCNEEKEYSYPTYVELACKVNLLSDNITREWSLANKYFSTIYYNVKDEDEEKKYNNNRKIASGLDAIISVPTNLYNDGGYKMEINECDSGKDECKVTITRNYNIYGNDFNFSGFEGSKRIYNTYNNQRLDEYKLPNSALISYEKSEINAALNIKTACNEDSQCINIFENNNTLKNYTDDSLDKSSDETEYRTKYNLNRAFEFYLPALGHLQEKTTTYVCDVNNSNNKPGAIKNANCSGEENAIKSYCDSQAIRLDSGKEAIVTVSQNASITSILNPTTTYQGGGVKIGFMYYNTLTWNYAINNKSTYTDDEINELKNELEKRLIKDKYAQLKGNVIKIKTDTGKELTIDNIERSCEESGNFKDGKLTTICTFFIPEYTIDEFTGFREGPNKNYSILNKYYLPLEDMATVANIKLKATFTDLSRYNDENDKKDPSNNKRWNGDQSQWKITFDGTEINSDCKVDFNSLLYEKDNDENLKYAFTYRPIDLKDPFPDREAGFNWQNHENELNGIGSQEEQYSATLTNSNIREIRAYNDQEETYLRWHMRKNGIKYYSEFIDDLVAEKIIDREAGG